MLESVLSSSCESGGHYLDTLLTYIADNITAVEDTGQQGSYFRLKPFAVTWQCVCRCWEDGVFIGPLLHRFWKLSVQVREVHNNKSYY